MRSLHKIEWTPGLVLAAACVHYYDSVKGQNCMVGSCVFAEAKREGFSRDDETYVQVPVGNCVDCPWAVVIESYPGRYDNVAVRKAVHDLRRLKLARVVRDPDLNFGLRPTEAGRRLVKELCLDVELALLISDDGR
jgi:hypothetical protein